MNYFKSVLLIFLLGISCCCITPTLAYSQTNVGDQCVGSVTRVFDADTVLFKCEEGTTLLVRLAGIDAPEHTKKNKLCWQQPFGDTAGEQIKQSILNKKLILHITDRDIYHRWIGLLNDNYNHTINASLVEQGLAHVYYHYSHPFEWEALEKQAQQQRKGLWRNPSSCVIAPHRWRKMSQEQRCEKEIFFQHIGCQF